MNHRSIVIGLAGIGFSVGIFAGWQLSARPARRADAVSALASKSRQMERDGKRKSEGKQKAEPTLGKHDFATLVRYARKLPGKPSALKLELGRMDAGGLKALALELSASLKVEAPPEEKQAAYGVLQAAMQELYRREGERALEWAGGISHTGDRFNVLTLLLSELAQESPEKSRKWISKHRDEYGDDWAWNFYPYAMVGANGRGAEDVIKVMELFASDSRGMMLNMGNYAEDFDFHRLVTAFPYSADLNPSMEHWAARDKEAAWAAVNEVITADGAGGASYMGSLLKGAVALESDETAAAWTVSKLELLSGETKERALRSITSTPFSVETMTALVNALPAERDRVSLASEYAMSRPAIALPVMQALGSEAAQIQTLLNVALRLANYTSYGNPPSKETVDSYTTIMEQLRLAPEFREKFHEVLVSRTPVEK